MLSLAMFHIRKVRVITLDTFTLGNVAMSNVSRSASVFALVRSLARREVLFMLVGLLNFWKHVSAHQ